MKKLILVLGLFLLSANSHSMKLTDGSVIAEGAREWNKYQIGTGHNVNNALMYSGFVIGISNVLAISKLACIPSKSDGNEIVATVTKYILDKPQVWSLDAVQIISNAIVTYYPCKQ
ncbi:MAG: Rap1a/Tai family immunity protein [Methylococcaceae bacterium]